MPISRRRLIKGSSLGLLAGASGVVGARSAETAIGSPVQTEGVSKALLAVNLRAQQAYSRRVRAAGLHLLSAVNQGPQPLNSDESTVPGFAGNFTKTLAHNERGEVDPAAYNLLVDALNRNDFSDVVLSPVAQRKLANPSAAATFEIHGDDSHSTRIAAAPSIQSAESATEMIEVYWQAMTRDIKFDDYATSPEIANAITDLNLASFRIGPSRGGNVTLDNVFRGSTPGDLTGPYISQLLIQPIAYGAGVIEQRYLQPVAGNDFMTEFDEYLAIQNGARPTRSDTFAETPRYIQSNRDLANYVHNDVLFQAYYNAAIILLSGSAPLKDENPFNESVVEGGFVTFGGPDVLNMVAQSARMALTGAWYQKWLQRRLRPEAMGARIDVQRRGEADYGIHPDVMTSQAVAELVDIQGNALLPQAFPEGSPTHPAYPAGHACVAGACATILKAWFREDAPFPNARVPNADGTELVAYNGPTLTVAGEINKLANNISIGRNAAGVHWRSDGEQGMLGGEQQAIGLLKDYSLAYAREFNGFTLTTFNGIRIRIANGVVSAI